MRYDKQETVAGERCQVCGEVGEDRRTLKLRYFYDLAEYGLDLDPDEHFYNVRTCKDCRADFLTMLVIWARGDLVKVREDRARQDALNGVERNIFIRLYGTNVGLTEEEWREINGDRMPVRPGNEKPWGEAGGGDEEIDKSP